MTAALDRQRTLRCRELSDAHIYPEEIVISAGDATENRGQLSLWRRFSAGRQRRVLWINHIDRERVSIAEGAAEAQELSLYGDIGELLEVINAARVLLDISGLQHHVVAALIKALYDGAVPTRVLYAEPQSYRQHTSPASATLFDLSVTFSGLAPLPGFARLSGPVDEDLCVFVAMLGFEGSRPGSLVYQLEPMPKVIPVIGVPGFQVDFPEYTVTCNRAFLEECRAYSEIRFARASCPFEAFEVLEKIRRDYPQHYMYLAPVGTKPHALGVLLYALRYPDYTEVMFDHPVRRPGRTAGVGTIHIYDLSRYDKLRTR